MYCSGSLPDPAWEKRCPDKIAWFSKAPGRDFGPVVSFQCGFKCLLSGFLSRSLLGKVAPGIVTCFWTMPWPDVLAALYFALYVRMCIVMVPCWISLGKNEPLTWLLDFRKFPDGILALSYIFSLCSNVCYSGSLPDPFCEKWVPEMITYFWIISGPDVLAALYFTFK